MTDDMGYAILSCCGKDYSTPDLDKLTSQEA